MLNKDLPLPLYYQIEEYLKRKIEEREFGVGELIPSERELSERFQVSRMTVRQAVTNLVNAGVLYREKGKGTFVAERKIEQPLKGLTSFTEDMRQRGMSSSSKLIAFEAMVAPGEIREKLKLKDEEEIYCVRRIRMADRKPMAIETTFMPVKLLPGLTEKIAKGSIYHYVEQELGMAISHARQMIEARAADEEQAHLLDILPQSPVLHIERSSLLSKGIPFEVVRSTYRADRYSFISDIER
ncbi:transcriptional regulator, GntR family [Halobacillus karajensis]|uniref:HTH-type transcriptional repressor YvoA n=1 Tax=Halobacillus karajensis TaxID=195088 RepID=A0A024P828_9BACI|nr:GntR family transcriptional regulator [Halobacillus karajensis]CDQ21060.1 HTH-type transcriptional repressor YvoA [Halobacillus karajensis]CDQ24876.1 HTH-type transcriptional repressor YvoA [Halobacillus karajensis]CDQ28764.1 HTH-type transcriptional repressor YvoA [Halobacillus karajensis]SEH96757.1 transcriptional regulator, GntR family [Halobacillus karajensis]